MFGNQTQTTTPNTGGFQFNTQATTVPAPVTTQPTTNTQPSNQISLFGSKIIRYKYDGSSD